MERWDVLIIGGGPAGATAAVTLARQGVRTALLDKARFPRPKLCGGLLTRKTMRLLERVHGLIPAQGLEQGVLDHAASGYQVFQRNRMLFQSLDGYPFHFVRRHIFDAHLLQQAAAAGVDVRENCEVEDVAPEEGRLLTRQGRTLAADWILAADGVSSVARKRCGVDARAWKHNMAMAMEIHLPISGMPDPPLRPRVYTGYLGGGYCWSFPNRNQAVIGACELLRSHTPLKRRFKDFLQGLQLDLRDLPQPRAHLLPYGNYLPHPAQGRVLLAGDAAGMVEPLFGEGIYYALRTGELAAQAILEHAAQGPEAVEQRYVSAVNSEILPEFRWSKVMRNLLYYSRKLNAIAPIKSLSVDGGRRILDIIHGERSFRLFGKRQGA